VLRSAKKTAFGGQAHNIRVKTMPTMPLFSGGNELDTSAEKFGFLDASNDAIAQPELLKDRMERSGYLYFPGFFNRDDVKAARLAVCEELAAEGLLDPEQPVELAIAKPDANMAFRPDIANGDKSGKLIRKVIYGEKIMEFFSTFLGGGSTHYDFTWMRTIAPGLGSQAHCDVIFMGRGTTNLYTAWVPFGDVPLNVGGLLLIEGSHHDNNVLESYCTMDYDSSCQNRPDQHPLVTAGFHNSGAISENMPEMRNTVGGRLLTAEEYKMGDLLIFSVFLVHGSLDNHSKEIRLSTDSRYQLKSDPIDERWIGEHPPGHGGKSVVGMIC
jgi:hypothetical protein